ncbi:MAG TPA: GDSL-type esterase/lipase family protein [Candidatus Brocadiia bacterium]|nr:GDSL-type esterase/lipase family protein [Candidatus Brocadiia bacterium]
MTATHVAAGLLALCALAPAAAGAELLANTDFAAGSPAATIKGWDLYGPLGGSVKPLPKSGALLGTTRVQLPDGGESWEGALAANTIEVLPGRKYRFQIEARGVGPLTFGVLEYGWKYSAAVIGKSATRAELTPEAKVLVFDYTPTQDRVSHVRPFVQVTGWWRRAELRRASFVSLAAAADIALTPGHFAAPIGGALPLTVQSAHYPVKLLLYGPTGDAGPGGGMGGSGAFTDIFKSAMSVQGAAGQAVTVSIPIPTDALQGSYRLVAVDLATGGSKAAHFTAMPKADLDKTLALLKTLNLPDGATLVFLGDSLTANFPNRNYPALLDRALTWRFGGKVKVINAGIGGNNILQMAERLDKDVLARNPTHVFLFEGANDCKRTYQPATGELSDWVVPADKYEAAFRDIVSRLAEKKVKVIVMTCAPGDPVSLDFFAMQKKVFGEGGNLFCLPDEVAKIVAIQKRAAADLKADLIDTHRLLSDYMARRQQTNSPEHLHVDDGVHLSEYGNREVARIVLEYLAGGK